MAQDPTHLIWIDLEMTGLDPQGDEILEIATVVTDKDLNAVAEGPQIAIHHPQSRLDRMDDWNQRHHTSSGLLTRVRASRHDTAAAERETLAFVQRYLPPRTSPMCGNSICQDRRFLARLMPSLEAFFHYRNLDVSSLKELANRWAPDMAKGFFKESKHLALDDVRDSIAELRYYREHFLRLPEPGPDVQARGASR
jgi:oligoribonuclease